MSEFLKQIRSLKKINKSIVTNNKFLINKEAKQNPKFKKFLTTKNVIIISLVYIVAVSFISGKNVAYGFGAIFTSYVITLINSVFRKKFKFKNTFDDKFYPFFYGTISFCVHINNPISYILKHENERRVFN